MRGHNHPGFLEITPSFQCVRYYPQICVIYRNHEWARYRRKDFRYHPSPSCLRTLAVGFTRLSLWKDWLLLRLAGCQAQNPRLLTHTRGVGRRSLLPLRQARGGTDNYDIQPSLLHPTNLHSTTIFVPDDTLCHEVVTRLWALVIREPKGPKSRSW